MDDDLFVWASYLEETHSKSIPSPVFKHIVPECMCGFEPGMKLEVPNKDYKNTYWLATIVAKATPLILVRYEGFQDNNEEDFWCNTLSDDIHPVGWCAKSKHALKPPRVIQHKEQNWYSYLIKNLTGTKKASENLFLKKSHPAHYLRAGQYVEILDPHAPLCYWLARINEVFQGRLNLQYEGWEGQEGEFWCFYLHENLRPVGHGIKNELKLCPPKGAGPFSTLQHNRLLEKVSSISKRIDNSIFNSLFMGWTEKCPHELTVGMKLESTHPLDPTGIHVASVCRVFDEHYFLVQIDTLLTTTQDDMKNSFIAHKTSSTIFPVGWCLKNGLILNQPAGYIGKFTWDAYLKYSKADPVPESFFTDIDDSSSDIEVGMKLEAVDKENKRHICVCTVTKIVKNQLWLHIDGDTRSDQIFQTDSHDIFPIGWCESTGHELQWPRPYTLEQKNRISSLRSTVSRQNRLEILRKGKLRADAKNSKEIKKDFSLNKRKLKYLKGGRKKRVYYDDTDSSSYADNTLPIVCINQLAKEYNTEDCIKKSFGLDSNGRLPMEVVTIDDDEEEDEDIPLASFKNEPKYNEKDLTYLSYIRVKPKNLTKSENDLFEKKLKENENNCELDMDTISTPTAKSEKRSLSSVVAMLRSSNKHSRTQLLELYKKNKARRQGKSISEKENSILINQPVIDLCDDNGDSEIQSNSPDSSGEYHVVQKIMTKPGDKNKIILKLGRPTKSDNNNLSHPESGPTFSNGTTNSNLNLTHVNDMQSVTNMVRRQPGLNEIMKTRCHKVRGLCKDLPKNPLLWTKRHVALFIQNADFKKYAKKFFDQEIDGHSLLLLTVWEIHHLLGVNLGPAMKIHDYIFSLQQLVNDAYLKSKNKVLLQSKPSN